jgi:hypothetical protein
MQFFHHDVVPALLKWSVPRVPLRVPSVPSFSHLEFTFAQHCPGPSLPELRRLSSDRI